MKAPTAVLVLSCSAMLTAETTYAPDLAQLDQMMTRFARVDLRVDISRLSAGDRAALAKLVEAAGILNDIFMRQLWSGDVALFAKLKADTSALGRARLRCFWINKGPWSNLDGNTAFLPGVPGRKPPGANFYPQDMTREEFERWVKTLNDADRKRAEGFFTLIRRGAHGELTIVPYGEEYRDDLTRAASLLRGAAEHTGNATLKRFLTERARAFLTSDYYESDVAWMDLDAPVDITIGPYETYNDELFGYKAAFEAYVNVRDEAETKKLEFFSDHLQEIENNLPIDPKYRNPKIGALAPIRVVDEIFAAGDGDHGVKTAAYNLPNDERVVVQKGTKRVMLKNIQEAKFNATLVPISKRVLAPAAQSEVAFEPFFTHILAHELSHGIGPQQIAVNGRRTTVRQELKDLYSAIEEAKADVLGLFMLQYMYDHGLLPAGEDTSRKLYTTYLASSFRTLRFGLMEAHGKGMALQLNYLLDNGGVTAAPDGTFAVNQAKIAAAVRGLAHELLMVEATGDYSRANQMLNMLGVIRPEVAHALAKLNTIPVDIDPVFVTAAEVTGSPGQF